MYLLLSPISSLNCQFCLTHRTLTVGMQPDQTPCWQCSTHRVRQHTVLCFPRSTHFKCRGPHSVRGQQRACTHKHKRDRAASPENVPFKRKWTPLLPLSLLPLLSSPDTVCYRAAYQLKPVSCVSCLHRRRASVISQPVVVTQSIM